MSISLQQLHAIIQAKAELPTATWYATIDAAQVSHERAINWQELAEKHQWRNLLDGTVEGKEPELTCWLIVLSSEMLALTETLIQNSPFSCTWLQSTWPVDSIAAYWQHTSNTRLPNGHNGLLRFYDPCVLQALQTVLSPSQLRILHAPIGRWLYIDRFGALSNTQMKDQPVRRNGQIKLSQEQLKQLKEAGQVDRIILNMQANEHLATDIDPFSTYKQISTALNLLKKHDIIRPQDQYLFSALTLDWPLSHFNSPTLDQALAQIKHKDVDLTNIIVSNPPAIN